jgi:hypothetical protein
MGLKGVSGGPKYRRGRLGEAASFLQAERLGVSGDGVALRGAFFAIATLALAVVLQTLVVNWDYVGGSRGAYIIRPEQITAAAVTLFSVAASAQNYGARPGSPPTRGLSEGRISRVRPQFGRCRRALVGPTMAQSIVTHYEPPAGGAVFRQPESGDSDKSAENLGNLLRDVSKTSIGEIDNLISELKALRRKLQIDGDRIQRDIAEYAELSQQVMQLTTIISDSVKKLPGHAA